MNPILNAIEKDYNFMLGDIKLIQRKLITWINQGDKEKSINIQLCMNIDGNWQIICGTQNKGKFCAKALIDENTNAICILKHLCEEIKNQNIYN